MKGKRKIVVVTGSDSDLPKIAAGINLLRIAEKQGLIEVHEDTCSAHRNPMDLERNLEDYISSGVDVLIACASKLADLFGRADSLLRNKYYNASVHVVAVPLIGDNEQATLAAILSAKEVPGSQFIYQDVFAEDHTEAFKFAIDGKLPEIVVTKPSVRRTIAEVYEMTKMKLPPLASYDFFIRQMEDFGLFHMFTGKTRETFMNPVYPNLLFIYATNRISIFDRILNATIEDKGAVLTAAAIWWLTKVFPDIPNHLVAYGSGILEFLPDKMRREMSRKELSQLMQRMIVVRKAKVFKVEAIIRGNLTGSGYKDYLKTRSVCGIPLPAGLIDGSELPNSIFTPSTKADYGQHDENISFEKMIEMIGKDAADYIREKSLIIFLRARARAREFGIIIADTKFEWGIDVETGKIILVDEILTPDSSRFWPEDKWKMALKKKITPPSMDKQPVRIAGEKGGIKTDNPNWVPSVALCEQTRKNYRLVLSKLANGKSLEEIWASNEMGVWGA